MLNLSHQYFNGIEPSIIERFVNYHSINPHVYDLLKDLPMKQSGQDVRDLAVR